VAGGLVVHLDLVFDGVAYSPANLLNALRTQYGATKVAADTDTVGQNAWRLRITP
jgi:hypothetical protein